MRGTALGNELKGLFGGFGGVIAAACLEGTMGRVRASASGRSAAAEIGDFAFFAGEADGDLLSGCAAARYSCRRLRRGPRP